MQGKAITLWWLGHIANQQDNSSQALVYLNEAFEILQRIKSPKAQAVQSLIHRIENS